MVCLGNICRSPMAEGIMRYKIDQNGLGWEVRSAGTESYHIGEAPHLTAQRVCRVHGIDISGQRATRFTAQDFHQYDKIYAMAGDVLQEMKYIAGSSYDGTKALLFLNELRPGGNQSVPDPYYGTEEDFNIAYDLIERTCDVIIEKYRFET